jgi:predicted nucleic acid-binding protein
MLLDSNIIIYAAQVENVMLREFIAKHEPVVSALSYVETLGYHRLQEIEKQFLEEFFTVSLILPISQPVIEQAVKLRQIQKMSLGDAIIAATALSYNYQLVTRNIKDFQWIEGLKLLNPFEIWANLRIFERFGVPSGRLRLDGRATDTVSIIRNISLRETLRIKAVHIPLTHVQIYIDSYQKLLR